MHLSWDRKSQSMKFFFLHLEAITLFAAAALDIAVQKFVMSSYTDLYIPILSFLQIDMVVKTRTASCT